MSRYFFHIKRGQLTILDREGMTLGNVEEATKEATQRGRQIATAEAQMGIPPPSGLIIVEDEWERQLFDLPF